jgi:ABC-type multidrug transport system fused ATPase/permease subunit
LSSDTAKIENAVSTQVSMLVKSGVYNLVVLVMFFVISWKMTLFTLGVMLPTMCFGPVYGRFMRKINKQISDEKAAASNIAEEAFSNIRTVKAFATEDTECIDYAQKNDSVFAMAKRAARCYGGFQFMMTFVMFGSMDALIYFAAFLNSKDGLSIGDFTSFQFYMFSFLLNFMTVAQVIGDVMGVLGTTESVAEIYMHEPLINIEGGEAVT